MRVSELSRMFTEGGTVNKTFESQLTTAITMFTMTTSGPESDRWISLVVSLGK